MKSDLSRDEHYFVVNSKGRKTHALLPIKEYERLIEDQYDNEVAKSRENEESIPLEAVKARIRSRRPTSI